MILDTTKHYQICNTCVMDTSDPDITFNEQGNCNNCTNAIVRINKEIFISDSVKKVKLSKIIKDIKEEGKSKEYDCIIGLSGGVDSSYLAYIVVKQFGLKVLAVHLDNGWNSELAVSNIKNIVSHLNIDLHTEVLNWEEFKSLQIAFLKASVIDLEMLTDHAIGVALYKISKKYNIKYFLSGYNYQSESIMPSAWLYPNKMDSLNIKHIFKKHGNGINIKSFEYINFIDYLSYGKNKMKLIPILNYLDYHKKDALVALEKELGWRNYGNKHDESIFTKFYQDVILPKKFGIDKRKAHLSSLICSNQITREEALRELEKPLYTEEEYHQNLNYFLKKLQLTVYDYNAIMQNKPVDHWKFKSYAKRKHLIGKAYRFIFKK